MPYELKTSESTTKDTVTIDGVEYRTRGTTRGTAQAELDIQARQKKIDANKKLTDEQRADQNIECLCDIVALHLTPAKAESESAAKVLFAAWTAGDLEVESIAALAEFLQADTKARAEALRPPA